MVGGSQPLWTHNRIRMVETIVLLSYTLLFILCHPGGQSWDCGACGENPSASSVTPSPGHFECQGGLWIAGPLKKTSNQTLII